MIAIIDYGMGNIHSVQKALEYLGAKTLVTSQPEDIKKADRIVLPGVGAFSDAMDELDKRALTAPIKEAVKNNKPFLGICLGMQLLFNESEEGKPAKGLGLIEGKIKRFNLARNFKIPHIGWNQIRFRPSDCPLLNGLDEGAYMYFCHAYYPQPKDKAVSAATTEYGIEFASLVCKDNIFGTQFHPEKSQEAGLKIIENFVKL